MGLMLYYDRIDLSERIDPAKTNISKECATIGFSIMYSNFKILFLMVVTS